MPPSIANLLELSDPSPCNSPVQAYAKLEFGAYSFYVQSLSVTLGRKAAENDHVDVHLGNTKAISRHHARIQYSFGRNGFEIFVGGRNGLFVDDVFYDQGAVVPLEDRTQIQIGEIKFNFLLPHQGTLSEDPVEDKDSSDLSSLESSTPTPPSETEAEKPDIPYATLIAQSLLSHPRRRRTLQEIYLWIQDHHAWFKGRKGWQSSIRHNLASSPAFVPYGPKTSGNEATGKKTKRGQDEWGISPEYEGLIGNLSAREGDTDKISTKLNKKKAVASQQPKPKPPPPPPTVSPTPPPAPTQKEDKSKLEMLVKNMQGKGVDMGALLQEALAKMKGLPAAPTRTPQPPTPQPSIKKQRIDPSTASPTPSLPASANAIQQRGSTTNAQPPISVPMPLPYNPLKMAPIPVAGDPQVKQETPPLAPVAVIPPTQPPPILSPDMPFKGPIPSASPPILPIPVNPAEPPTRSPPILHEDPATSEEPIPEPSKLATEINGIAETGAIKVGSRGKKRPHNG